MHGILNNLFIINRNILERNSYLFGSLRNQSARLDSKTHKVNNLEKKFLVWTGKYKAVEDVPAFVEQNVVERARNRMRIRIANYMMAATAVGCLIMVYLGKKAAQRGDSVSKQNIEWHRQFNEASKKENP